MEELWRAILQDIQRNPRDFHTHLRIQGRKPIWFYAEVIEDTIRIRNARNHELSSSISQERKLTFEEFKRIYPIYLRREEGESVSQEAINKTYNQVYWFGILFECLSRK